MCILLDFRDAIQKNSNSKIIYNHYKYWNKNLFQISLNSLEYNYICLLTLIETKLISYNKHKFQKIYQN